MKGPLRPDTATFFKSVPLPKIRPGGENTRRALFGDDRGGYWIVNDGGEEIESVACEGEPDGEAFGAEIMNSGDDNDGDGGPVDKDPRNRQGSKT